MAARRIQALHVDSTAGRDLSKAKAQAEELQTQLKAKVHFGRLPMAQSRRVLLEEMSEWPWYTNAPPPQGLRLQGVEWALTWVWQIWLSRRRSATLYEHSWRSPRSAWRRRRRRRARSWYVTSPVPLVYRCDHHQYAPAAIRGEQPG